MSNGICPTKSHKLVESKSQCEAIAKELEVSDKTAARREDSSRPRGCFVISSKPGTDVLFFNIGGKIASRNTRTQALCCSVTSSGTSDEGGAAVGPYDADQMFSNGERDDDRKEAKTSPGLIAAIVVVCIVVLIIVLVEVRNGGACCCWFFFCCGRRRRKEEENSEQGRFRKAGKLVMNAMYMHDEGFQIPSQGVQMGGGLLGFSAENPIYAQSRRTSGLFMDSGGSGVFGSSAVTTVNPAYEQDPAAASSLVEHFGHAEGERRWSTTSVWA
jgi:hypothetical protein